MNQLRTRGHHYHHYLYSYSSLTIKTNLLSWIFKQTAAYIHQCTSTCRCFSQQVGWSADKKTWPLVAPGTDITRLRGEPGRVMEKTLADWGYTPLWEKSVQPIGANCNVGFHRRYITSELTSDAWRGGMIYTHEQNWHLWRYALLGITITLSLQGKTPGNSGAAIFPLLAD